MQVSIIIPAHNEAKFIASVLTFIPQEYEIIVVDDGSIDGTKNITQRFPGIKTISHPKRFGKGAALKTGIKNATGEILVFIDGDNQFDSSEIIKLVDLIQESRADFVLGIRDFSKIPIVRRITNRFTRFIIYLITGRKFKDPLIGFRAVSRNYIQQIELEKNDFRTETEMLIKLKKTGCKIEEIPVSINYDSNNSYFGIKQAVKLTGFLFEMLLRKKVDI